MIACLLERGLINDFLNRFPSNKWYNVIPCLVELGILYLYRNNKHGLLTVDSLADYVDTISRDIIYPNNNKNNKERGRNKNNNIFRRTSKPRSQSGNSFNAKKPSSEWRKGDTNVSDRSISKIREIYSSNSCNIYLYR